MLIESGWKPGVWIDGDHSSKPINGDVFGTFAHLVHDDLLAVRAAGRIATHVEITVSASTIRPLWGDEPPVWLLHIRFAGLADPRCAIARDELAFDALSILDRRERDQLPVDMVDRYGVRLFFVDEHGSPLCSRTHALRTP
ncbi:hypothetical protein [Amycolatopsis sp. NPDC098790]|uniref:hypothetical protein n=1 Tax=Amycolatopsis sp. NPDC098790 TaxID=3363939 RepID=UPI003828C65D